MQRWEKANAWKQYKRYYTQLQQAKTARAVEAIDLAVSDFEGDLEKIFPEHPRLVQDLMGVLTERATLRLRAVQPSRGRRPKPDDADTLARTLKRLRYEYGALRGLRALDGEDPWVEETFLPDVQHTRAAVTDLLMLIERGGTEDPRIPPLRQEAQPLLIEMKEALGDISRGPRPGR